VFRHAQQVIGQPGSTLRSYAGEFMELLDQTRNRFSRRSESRNQNFFPSK
jgi:hypothetical protein